MSSAYLNNAKSWVSQPHHHLQGAFWLDKSKNHCGRSLDFGRSRKSPATCHPGKRITSSASTRISTLFTGNIPFLMWITPGLRMDSAPRWQSPACQGRILCVHRTSTLCKAPGLCAPPPTLHNTCQNKGQNKCKKSELSECMSEYITWNLPGQMSEHMSECASQDICHN